MRIIKALLSGMFLLLLLSSCSKDVVNNLSAEEKPLYITNLSPSVSFSGYGTYSLADSVAVISNNQLVDRVRTDYDAALIAAIATQMTARGFTRVGHGDNPDIGISVSRVYSDRTGFIDYGSYWGGYGGYWDPYYWGYGGYNYYFPTMIGTYTITEGGVTVDMFDLKNAAANNQLSLMWTGLIRGTGTFNAARTTTHAEALFSQSPYIGQ